MRRFVQSTIKFLRGDCGASATEYAVFLTLLVMVCIGALSALRSNANAQFTSAKSVIGSGS